jgi:hypothetical protein
MAIEPTKFEVLAIEMEPFVGEFRLTESYARLVFVDGLARGFESYHNVIELGFAQGPEVDVSQIGHLDDERILRLAERLMGSRDYARTIA